jgi:L-alanine-DL-glutamate epimerase-like enolase superfamily enzyme
LRIVDVEVFPVHVPLREPMHMAGALLTGSDNVLVRVTADDGTAGWGEGVEAPAMTGETQSSIVADLDALRATLVGRDPRDRQALWHEMQQVVTGRRTAIAALDIALHDLVARALGVPVATLLGAAPGRRLEVLSLFGSGDAEADLAAFRARRDAGFRWFKLKIGVGTLAEEIDTLTRVAREAPEVVLAADANAGLDEHQARELLDALAHLPIRFVEQPVAGIDGLARLAESSRIPIAADESADSLQTIVRLGAAGISGVSLKLIKLGGITGVMRGAALCQTLGLSINLAGKVAETSISAAANIHCAAAIGETAFGCSPTNGGIAQDVTAAPLLPVGGVVTVPDGPGLGIEIDEERVRSMTRSAAHHGGAPDHQERE